jgi:glycosyltransferase involved in cell wall biosynthesis
VNIAFPFVGDSLGGSHLSTLILVEELIARGHSAVILISQRGELSEELDRRKLPYHIVPSTAISASNKRRSTMTLRIVVAFIPLVWTIKRFQIDVVHTNDHRMHILWTLPAKLSRVPHLWHQRTVVPRSRMIELLIRLPSARIAISEFVARSILRVSKKISTVVIGNPVKKVKVNLSELKSCRQEILKKAKSPQLQYLIGIFGQLSRDKNSIMAVKALKSLEQSIGIKAVLAYFGDDRHSYWSVIEGEIKDAGLCSPVLYMGRKRPVEPWMSACDVIFAPAIQDGFGRTLIEAMSLGVPVVAARAGGHVEIIEHQRTGLLYDPADEYDAAINLFQSLTKKQMRLDLKQMGLFEAQRYNEISHVSKIESVYFSLLNKKG